MPLSPEQIAAAGPWATLVAILVAALVVVVRVLVVLWREHLAADHDDRNQRDIAQNLLDQSLANNAAAIAAWNKRNDQDAARARRADPR